MGARWAVIVLLIFAVAGCGSPSSCKNVGQSCDSPNDCCAALMCIGLNSGHTGSCGLCLRSGEACSTASDCCSPLGCFQGKCGTAPAPTCGAVSAACSGPSDCCSPLVCTSGRCAIGTACRAVGETCAVTGDCCNPLTCSGGICRSATCRSAGQACAGSQDCCGEMVCFSGACSTAGMTWSIANQNSTLVYLRFYDETANLVWPDSTYAYYQNAGQVASYPIACTPGDSICFGIEDETRTSYWGVGIDNQYTCTDCCAYCDGKTHSVTVP
jgi:hypothetical protein